MRNEWLRLRRDESGAVIAFLVAIPVLAAMIALGMETGKLYTMQRQMQNAADSAALSGAKDLIANPSVAASTIISDARYEAQRAGFTNGVNGVSVNVSTTVNAPAGQAAYTNPVQVTITKPMSFSFAGVLNSALSSSSTFNMRATSVAAQGTYAVTTQQTTTSTTTTSSADACLVSLVNNGDQGMTFSNFSSFVSDCGVMSNSTASANSSSGASINISSFSSATMKYVWTRGSYYASGYSSLTPAPGTTNAKVSQTATITDPYASLTIPTLSTCNYTNYNPAWANPTVVSPGTYCGGLQVSSGGTIQFQPGTYYIANGDLYLTSSSNISCPTCTNGAGVTFVLTQTTGNNSDIGGVRITSDSTVSLSAPNSGTYAGILFYQDRRAPNGTMGSSSKIFTVSSISSATLNGAIYFPNNKIALSSFSNSGSSTTGCTVWVGRYLNLTSYSSTYTAGCKTYYNLTPPGIMTTTTTTSTAPVTSRVTKARMYQ